MKAKLIYALSALVMIATLLATSCRKSDDSVEPAPPITIPTEFKTLTLESSALNEEVTFKATKKWAVALEETTKAAPSWLTVSPMSGNAGSVTLNIEVEKNTIEKERSAEVTITAGGKDYTITITQDAGEAEVAATYAVTFNANGGSGTMATQTIEEDKATALTANAFTYADHTFSTWNTKSDGSGTNYADEASVTLSANLMLYAQWIENAATTHEVTFDANGGSGTMAAQTIEEDKATSLTANIFTRAGHSFAEWNTKANGSGTSYADEESVTLTAALKLYAQWTEVTVPVTEVEITPAGDFELTIGESKTLSATVIPENATNKAVTWTSSTSVVATVTEGVVVAKMEGKAKITATAGGVKTSITVTVKAAPVAVTGITVYPTSLSFIEGATTTQQVKATVTPLDASNKDVEWDSSNKAVATVDDNGVVTLASGATAGQTTTITATTVDGGKKAECAVSVTAATVAVTDVSFMYSYKDLVEGQTVTITAIVKPDNATNKTVEWKSSNTAVATVVGGLITAINPGEAIITATSVDGAKEATFKVVVSAEVTDITPGDNGLSDFTVEEW